MGVILGIIFYAILAYITCPRDENGNFESVALYIVIPVIFIAIYFICSD